MTVADTGTWGWSSSQRLGSIAIASKTAASFSAKEDAVRVSAGQDSGRPHTAETIDNAPSALMFGGPAREQAACFVRYLLSGRNTR